ncbi:MAG TPA: hypothetical protein VLK84_19130 [Longimicrobium sp.]|nr:hypothetical protein [Longimicrobium sp.]
MSNDQGGRGVFTGTSSTGNLQEALDAAVAQAGPGVPWRIASIEGLNGIVNSITVRIFAVTQAAAGKDKDGGGEEEPTFEVPTSRTGLVVDISGEVSICMDGAQFELVTQTDDGEARLRLKATNPEAERYLRDVAGSRQEVTVSGYIRRVECERMDVYDAAPATATELDSADAQADRPAPGGGEPTVTRQGTVEVLANEISFCQDGAEFELVTQTPEGEQRLRLSAANGRAGSVLRRFAGTGQEVSVTGTIVHVECTSMLVQQAEPVRAAAGATES